MSLRYLDDSGYSLGMIRDQPSWLIPPGGLYDSLNCVYDKPGIVRQRGGTTALVSGSQTAFCTSIGFVYAQDATPIEELYGLDGKTGTLYNINKTNGSASSLGTAGAASAMVGRPARHFGFAAFPSSGLSGTLTRTGVVLGGTTSSSSFTNAATASCTASNPQVTLGADSTTNIKVGAIVFLSNSTNQHYARVVSIDSAKLFTIWPAPIFTDAAVPISDLTTRPYLAVNGGACAASFQNRLLWGNTTDLGASRSLISDRRVYYSPLPTESGTFGVSAGTSSGATFIGTALWPTLNYFDVPGSDPIVAMEPTSENELLILTATHPVIFRGNLVTQLSTTNPTITFDLADVNQPTGCLSDLSVQRTPRGIVWAGAGGIYAYAGGGQVADLTKGLVNTYWRGLTNGSSFAVHGSAYVRGQYIVSGISGGSTFSLTCDLTGSQPKWGRLSGAGTDLFYGLARPSNPSQVFANRWWDQTGAAPSMTNGQVVRLESVLDPYTVGATKTDSDGTAVALSLTTRTIGGDVETQKLFQRGTVRHQQSSTTAAVTVTAQSTIDAADIDASRTRALGSLSNTATLTLSNATNANPIVCTTTAVHGLQSDDFVDVDAVLGNLNANGRWRISVLSTTTFSLVGGIGSAAYTSGGKVKKLTETDYSFKDVNAGQGASLTIAGSPNNFELHGIRIAMLERAPVMSS